MNNKWCLLLVMSWCIGIQQPLLAQDTVAAEVTLPSLFGFLHQQDSIPVLKIETDWGLLVKNKFSEPYQPVTLTFSGLDGEELSVKCKMRARGNMRKRVCLYPPVKIKISKKKLAALGFNSNNDLKLVLPCRGGRHNQDCVLREALAYRLYEIINPVHIRTKVIRLQHWESGEEAHDFLAFLVEDEDEFADRIGGKVVNRGRIMYSGLDRDSYLKMTFFQYMIANTDWAVPNRHNLETVLVPGYKRLMAVPYDFDYAGMVGTGYAIPHESLPINYVTERHFQGRSVSRSEALATRAFFQEKKEELLQECEATTFLSEKTGAQAYQFIEDFFKSLESRKKVLRTFCSD